MMSSPLSRALNYYQETLASLQQAQLATAKQCLQVLYSRDRVHQALMEDSHPLIADLLMLQKLDQDLKKQIPRFAKVIDLAEYRASLAIAKNDRPASWWWYLEQQAPPHPWDRCDWLFKGLTLGWWVLTLGFLANIATRFVSGGPGVFGAIAVLLPTLLSLLQANSGLTQSGQQGFEKLIHRCGIPKHWHEEARCGATFILMISMIGFWASLPRIGEIYYRQGANDHQNERLLDAERNYQRAIALNPNHLGAHYNLGAIYEDLQDFEQAKREYQIALRGGLIEAYNNLARLYIQEEKPEKVAQAAALLTQALARSQADPPPDEVFYSLYKNLGWARFQQKRYEEAKDYLTLASQVGDDPQRGKYVPNPGAAHCLLAQVLDQQKQSSAIPQWQQCCQRSSRTNPDEDIWLAQAHQQLKKAGQSCKTP